MKKNKVKGFTLIELIIVVAIFSIIMFGAMQLMQPSRALFDRSFMTEDLSAGEKNIKMVLENNLRYAEFVQIDNQAYPYVLAMAQRPESAAQGLNEFVRNHYNGWVDKDGHSRTGKVYEMFIDNAAGGVITTVEYTFTAPNIAPGEATPSDLVDTSSAVIREYAVNRAFYDKYHYIISIGAAAPQAVSGHEGFYSLVKDDSYYGSFTNADLQTFGIRNCTFTISGYDINPRHGGTLVEGGVTYYSAMAQMSASLSLPNINEDSNGSGTREIYLHQNYVTKSDGSGGYELQKDAEGHTKWCNVISSGCNLGVDTATDNQFKIAGITNAVPVTDYPCPDHFRIIYTYPAIN